MADLSWLIRRLKAMSIPEVSWRLSQKLVQKREQFKFHTKTAVISRVFNQKIKDLRIDPSRMHLNLENRDFSLNTSIPLLSGYDYELYKKSWNAGFQTVDVWPETFSYNLEYRQRDDIGDARTNWELNRHFQFALLAKNYAATHDQQYLNEFVELFNDWNEKNPFLWGISWVSVMEVAIRCSNWCYAYCFLASTEVPDELLESLRIGILNMTDYVARHYSRYSSANNHLIVESYAIGLSGILCDYQPWVDLAVSILTRELPLQNYEDGVNKELSLHYQSFYMEAMGLMMRLMVKNDIKIPDSWYPMLTKMCEYLSSCIGDYGEVIEFGDNDEGKILDLQGGLNHYQYVLELFSCLLDINYTRGTWLQCENIRWIFERNELDNIGYKTRFIPKQYSCYKIGGNTILKSSDSRVLIGIDHAALGFGTIAAHGHADALSFQMYVDGKPVFIDPGTFIYHCDLESRNEFRKTRNHNTVCSEDRDQSEMLGAFLWGRKAQCRLIDYWENENGVCLIAEHDGYAPIVHRREINYDGHRALMIKDDLVSEKGCEARFILNPRANINYDEKTFILMSESGVEISIEFESGSIRMGKTWISEEYGRKIQTNVIVLEFKNESSVKIEIRGH